MRGFVWIRCSIDCFLASQVTFPDSVQWLALEFDSQCGTAQAEDSLQLYIPACRKHQVKPLLTSVGKDVQKNTSWWPVFKKFHGTSHWPSMTVVLPGGCEEWFNSLWPSDAIWQSRSGSTLAQVMAWCLMIPSHYLNNQCWLAIEKVQWHSYEGNFTRNTSDIDHKN